MQKIKKVLKALVKSKLKKADKKAEKKPVIAAKKAATKSPAKPATKKLPAKKSSPVVAAKPIKKAVVKVEKSSPKPTIAKVPKKLIEVAKTSKKDLLTKTKLETKSAFPEKTNLETAKKTKKIPAEKLESEKALKKTAKKVVEEEKIEDAPVEAKREYNDEEVVLTDAEGRRYCRVKDCDQISSVDAYCRYHYLLFWKKIQVRKKILTEGKLERYVEELTARYPDKYLEMLRKDLRSEKDFLNAIQELELDDNSGENDLEDEAQSFIEEVRGMSSEGGTTRDDDEF